MAFVGFIPSWTIVFLPVFLVEAIVFSLGLTFLISALNVKYRDFRFVVPFMVQIGLYVSPVGFSSNVIPEKWRIFYYLNPMAGIIDSFRWCISGKSPVFLSGCIVSLCVVIVMFILGVTYFRKCERSFADVI